MVFDETSVCNYRGSVFYRSEAAVQRPIFGLSLLPLLCSLLSVWGRQVPIP